MNRSASIVIVVVLGFLTACTPHKGVQDDDPETKDGVIKTYQKNGLLFSTTTMKDGKRNGMARTYFSNGKISVEANYKDDKKDGTYRQFYDDGTPMKVIDYTDDKINGLSKKYRSDGKLAWQAKFKNDLPCVGLVEYYLNGTEKKDYPTIVVEPEDHLADQGEYILRIRMSDGTTTVDYYEGDLGPDLCFDKTKLRRIYSPKRGTGVMEYRLIPGGFAMEELHLVAVIKTAQSNTYITTRVYHVAINN